MQSALRWSPTTTAGHFFAACWGNFLQSWYREEFWMGPQKQLVAYLGLCQEQADYFLLVGLPLLSSHVATWRWVTWYLDQNTENRGSKTYRIKKMINNVEYKATVMNQSHHSFPFTPKAKQEDWEKSMRRMLESAWHRFPLQLQECEGRELHFRVRKKTFGWRKKTFGWEKNFWVKEKKLGAPVQVSNNGSTVASYFGYLMLGELHRQGPVTGSPSDLQRQEVWGSCLLLALTRGACCGKDASLIL